MNPSLKRGDGRWDQLTPCLAFKMVLGRYGVSNHWDTNLSRKIFMINHTEEIRERYLLGFENEQIFSSQKLDLSLDDIINPIRVLEERSHKRGCHPGRLTLDPERYNQAFSDNRHFRAVRRSGGVPTHMRAGFPHTPWGKHRLLDISEDINNPHRRALAKNETRQSELRWGLQDMYFLGGMPLEYWCNGDSMGMRSPDDLPCSETYQWPGTAFRAQTDEEAGEGGDFSHVTACCRTYCFSRMWYLPTEMMWWKVRGQEYEFVDLHQRRPITWSGNKEWVGARAVVGRQLPQQLTGHYEYINYIQDIEDFCKLAKCEGFKDPSDVPLPTLWGISLAARGAWTTYL